MEPARREPVGLQTVVEFVGYAGAAVALAAASTALGGSTNEGVRIIFDLITAGVLLAAGLAIAGRPEPYPRMQSVFWFVSVLAVADLAGTLFGDVIGGLEGRMVVFVAGTVTAAYSFGLWWMLRRSLQAIALILSGYVAIIALVVPDGVGFIFGPPDLSAVGFVTWLLGGGIFVMGWLGWLMPRRTTLVLGSILALFGPLLFLIGGERVVGEILSLVTAFALMAAGEWIVERSVVGLGIAGTLIVSSTIVGNHVEDTGWAIVAVVIGLLLLGVAILLARGTPGGPRAPAPMEPPVPAPEDAPPRVTE
ncbi:MAG TPA: hypothetical protein VMP42_10330 [Actinomycetota bacterium]|nr:hypothetical protein [Actinomycetota bacterium]